MSEVVVKESTMSETLTSISEEYYSRWGVTKVRLSQNNSGTYDVWSAGVSTRLDVRPNDLLLQGAGDDRLDSLMTHLSRSLERTVHAVTLDLIDEPRILAGSCV